MYEVKIKFKIFNHQDVLNVGSLRHLCSDNNCIILFKKMIDSNFFNNYLNRAFKEIYQK
jgi:hypothetical protein